MRKSFQDALVLLVLTCLFSPRLRLVIADPTISITAVPAYTSLRVCARECLYCPSCGFGGDLGSEIKCQDGDQSPTYDDRCFCRRDLASSGSSFLTTCINTACSSISADINSAISVYNNYCGFDKSPITSSPVAQQTISSKAVPGSTSSLIDVASTTGDGTQGSPIPSSAASIDNSEVQVASTIPSFKSTNSETESTRSEPNNGRISSSGTASTLVGPIPTSAMTGISLLSLCFHDNY